MKSEIFILFFTILLAPLFAMEPEPFSAQEGAAIPIYEITEPLLSICVENMPYDLEFEELDDIQLSFEWITEIAKNAEIDLEPIKNAIVTDPEICDYIVAELKKYARKNLSIAGSLEGAEKENFEAVAVKAHEQAIILQFLIDTWAPQEKPMKEVK